MPCKFVKVMLAAHGLSNTFDHKGRAGYRQIRHSNSKALPHMPSQFDAVPP